MSYFNVKGLMVPESGRYSPPRVPALRYLSVTQRGDPRSTLSYPGMVAEGGFEPTELLRMRQTRFLFSIPHLVCADGVEPPKLSREGYSLLESPISVVHTWSRPAPHGEEPRWWT